MSSNPSASFDARARDGINVALKTLERYFLASLYVRAGQALLASFEEDVFVDVFRQMCNGSAGVN